MPTCLVPNSVQLNSRFLLPIGTTRRARSRWLVSIDTSGSSRYTDRPIRRFRIYASAKERTARQETLLVELLVAPYYEAFEHRFRLLLQAYELGLSRQAIVATLLFALVESGDRVQCLVGLRRLDILSVFQLDVLAVQGLVVQGLVAQGLVVRELVDDHAGNETDVGTATVQYTARSRRARQSLISA